MCFHPIKIRNPSLKFNEDIDKPYIEVPCGHCEACKQVKVNDLVTRAYYEWQSCVAAGGWSYFDTLTYSNDSVPKIFGTMCFSRAHLTKFFKNLRITLERDGYKVVDDNKNALLRYLVTTEYGDDDRYSKRPHYHIEWFCSIPGLSPLTFYKYVRKIWTYKYKFGWNDKITDVQKHIINRIDGIRYVCKYVAKGSDYEDRIKTLLKVYENDPDATNKILKNIKNIKPFYRASLGFGSSILNVDYQKLKEFGVPIFTSKGVEFQPMPKYIKYKLHYDKVSHPIDNEKPKVYKRNMLGVNFLIDGIDSVIDAKTLQYKNILDNEVLFSDEFYNLRDRIYKLLGSRSLRDFLVYKMVYKGHLWSMFAWYDYKEYFSAWLQEPRSNFTPFSNRIELDDYLSNIKHSIITDKSRLEWSGFDEIDEDFDFLFENYNRCLENAKIRKRNEEEQTCKILDRFCRTY